MPVSEIKDAYDLMKEVKGDVEGAASHWLAIEIENRTPWDLQLIDRYPFYPLGQCGQSGPSARSKTGPDAAELTIYGATAEDSLDTMAFNSESVGIDACIGCVAYKVPGGFCFAIGWNFGAQGVNRVAVYMSGNSSNCDDPDRLWANDSISGPRGVFRTTEIGSPIIACDFADTWGTGAVSDYGKDTGPDGKSHTWHIRASTGNNEITAVITQEGYTPPDDGSLAA